MIVQLPDGSLWQDQGNGTWAQIASGFDDPSASDIDPGTVEQVGSLPGPEAGAPDTSSLPTLIRVPDGAVFLLDGGAYRWIPDEQTAAAIGVDTSQATNVTVPGAPIGDNIPSVVAVSPPAAVVAAAQAPPDAPAPVTPSAAAAPATSFVWGNITWGPSDLYAFIAYLAAHGADYDTWAANHSTAAATFGVDTSDPLREPQSHSLGQALAAAIMGGDTPAQAAARTEALRKTLVDEGLVAVTPDQLLADANVVAATIAAAGGGTAADQDGQAQQPGVPDTRSLQSLQPAPVTPLAPGLFQPAGIGAAWRDLIQFFTVTLPANSAAVQARANALKSVF